MFRGRIKMGFNSIIRSMINMVNPEILAKALAAAYSTHPYTLPDGTVIKVQGYEDRALDLYLQTCLPSEIIIGTKSRHFGMCSKGKSTTITPTFTSRLSISLLKSSLHTLLLRQKRNML